MENEEKKLTLKTLTSETPKTRFCQKCDQEITPGKEIKFERVLEWKMHDAGDKYKEAVYSPTRTAIYYLCPECYEKVKQEIIRREKKWDRREWIIAGLLISIGLILMVGLIWTRDWTRNK